ncbi:hypothetical protein Pcinc_033745 [Petrolisthes cinctipes]|uniref:Uncharacterized protein n=1 Tax=Petrolisthes cinctipes TaxID=88211 RepID=A0AAE1ERN7_PETCI|nr:hypothetical protein Pcinc_033745 [Petrolisthes cinctipes]
MSDKFSRPTHIIEEIVPETLRLWKDGEGFEPGVCECRIGPNHQPTRRDDEGMTSRQNKNRNRATSQRDQKKRHVTMRTETRARHNDNRNRGTSK